MRGHAGGELGHPRSEILGRAFGDGVAAFLPFDVRRDELSNARGVMR
jgi:hypothetical protein